MRFPAKKNAGCPKAPRDFPPRKDDILYPRRVVLGLPSPSRRVCADGRSRDYYVTTQISRIDRLPEVQRTNFYATTSPPPPPRSTHIAGECKQCHNLLYLALTTTRRS